MNSHTPRVTIGLPVRNGGRYLYETVDTLLRQSYTDFELILSDNASDDNTREICQHFAAQDPRVKYVYFTENVGAARNFNNVASRARGEYFKWAAYDDLCGDDLLRACVQVLDEDPSAVLCYTLVGRMDENNEPRGLYVLDVAFDAEAPSTRFQDIINIRHFCLATFGVIRTEVLRNTPMIAPYVGSDRALLAELGLHGKLRQVDRLLFMRRDHPGTSLNTYPDEQARLAWLDPSLTGAISFPVHRVVYEYAQVIERTPLPPEEEARCRRALERYMAEGIYYTGAPVRDLLAQESERMNELRARVQGARAAGEVPPTAP